MSVLDFYSGAGGASSGFRDEGFTLVGGVDINPIAAATYENNLGSPVLIGDLMKLTPDDVRIFFGIRKADILIGCPPCQGFTSMRINRLASDDPRNQLVVKYLEFIKELTPEVVVFENVEGINRWRDGYYTSIFLKKLQRMHYKVAKDILDAANFGAPQFRKRFITLAMLGEDPVMPAPTHASSDLDSKGLLPWRTVHDEISRLRKLEAGEADPDDSLHTAPNHSEKVLRILRALPKDGGSRRDLPKELWLECHLKLENGFNDVYGRMRWSEPSPTITGGCITPSKGRYVHPQQDRGITLREAAMLQGFGRKYEFTGFRMQIAEQIGNALPTALARSIARVIKKCCY